MNTAKLKTFARRARTLLRAGVAHKIAYWGFAPDGTVTDEPLPVQGGYIFREKPGDDAQLPDRWQKLRSAVRAHGVEEVVERAAYTWFNRLMALKILEQNGYEQPQLAFTEPATGQPRLLQRARQGQTAFLTARERQRLQPLLADYAQETAAFGLLLVGFCHQPDHVLNRVFGHIDDYTELLLPDDLLAPGGFLYLLNTTDAIAPDDYGRVELIGWLYQFYISEKKDEVFRKFKGSQKAEPADIPAATQIFTPNWIVKYLVENTLGRTYLDHHPDSPLRETMKYLVEADSDSGQRTLPTIGISPENLTCLDPAVGSGHMLVEAFDLLMRVYADEYYLTGEAVRSILKHNLFGLDLDERAAQLARFALLMKAAQHDATVLREPILPNVYAMPEPAGFSRADLLLFLGAGTPDRGTPDRDGREHEAALADALDLMQQAQNLGSLMRFDLTEDARTFLLTRWQTWETQLFRTLAEELVLTNLRPFLAVLDLLTRQYTCLTANPPYMGAGNMNNPLKLYVNQHYARAKADLFAVFMDVCEKHCLPGGRWGMINQHSWMFLSSFEEFRKHLVNNQTIETMIHLGIGVFEELNSKVVQSTAFTCRNTPLSNISHGTYFRLLDYLSIARKEKAFLEVEQKYEMIKQENFKKISNTPIAYWISEKITSAFISNKSIANLSFSEGKNVTGDNNKYLRFTWEVSKHVVGSNKKWFLLTKGGDYRKWYGNTLNLIDWDEDALSHYKKNKIGRVIPKALWSRRGITWSKITSGKSSFRFLREDSTFDEVNLTLLDDDKLGPVIAFLNSKVASKFLEILNPGISFQTENILSIPFAKEIINRTVDRIAETCIAISKRDWDSRETSWDFAQNPLLAQEQPTLEAAYGRWETAVTGDFYALHQHEEDLNRIFIDLYGLQDELTPEVPLRDITILQEELERKGLTLSWEPLPIRRDVVMQQFVSYAIGCLMGRYRLDQPGLHIAHPNALSEEINAGDLIDSDGIIPLMGNRSAFADDAVGRVREFIRLVWGDDVLTRNLNFLQATLDRDVDTYLVRDFWGHHVRRYQKKPIYWLFSSPKGAFQVLVYMHRMNRFTAEKVRSQYLLRHLQHLNRRVAELSAVSPLNKADAKQLDQLRRDRLECETYDLLLKDVADRQIEFDLDDGVTRNLALFRGVVAEVR